MVGILRVFCDSSGSWLIPVSSKAFEFVLAVPLETETPQLYSRPWR